MTEVVFATKAMILKTLFQNTSVLFDTLYGSIGWKKILFQTIGWEKKNIVYSKLLFKVPS